ncbi:DUF3280 domain-containing protein [Hyphomicrobium facile]|uniref:DUF2380 domain-containing protein n=1 Tax=Hyphomicrobium facile TaxID=51670 RepID=A0A1I7MXI4_9HYPH|nr:DUF3280 domain-containing protein [Hyphomicrobium facile]SFV27046.1 Protein of unknown function [Hyphomicrobium facile]
MPNIMTSAAMRVRTGWVKHALQIISAFAISVFAAMPAHADPQRIAFLGIQMQNDNEGYEPTSDAERNRMRLVSAAFKKMLADSGKYTFVSVPATEQQKIEAGQAVGVCGGCEFDYGRNLNVERVAWIRVQKISNLILNLNVYIADVPNQRIGFVHSVDLRNNTDESWIRGIHYLVQNYLLPNAQG